MSYITPNQRLTRIWVNYTITRSAISTDKNITNHPIHALLVSRARKPYRWRCAAATKSVLLFGRIPQIAKDINRDRIWVIPPKWIRNVFPVVALLHHHRRTGAGKDLLLAGKPVQSDFQPQAPKRKETFKQQPNHEYARVYLLLLVCTCPWVAHIMYGMTWRNFTPGRFFCAAGWVFFFPFKKPPYDDEWKTTVLRLEIRAEQPTKCRIAEICRQLGALWLWVCCCFHAFWFIVSNRLRRKASM